MGRPAGDRDTCSGPQGHSQWSPRPVPGAEQVGAAGRARGPLWLRSCRSGRANGVWRALLCGFQLSPHRPLGSVPLTVQDGRVPCALSAACLPSCSVIKSWKHEQRGRSFGRCLQGRPGDPQPPAQQRALPTTCRGQGQALALEGTRVGPLRGLRVEHTLYDERPPQKEGPSWVTQSRQAAAAGTRPV